MADTVVLNEWEGYGLPKRYLVYRAEWEYSWIHRNKFAKDDKRVQLIWFNLVQGRKSYKVFYMSLQLDGNQIVEIQVSWMYRSIINHKTIKILMGCIIMHHINMIVIKINL